MLQFWVRMIRPRTCCGVSCAWVWAEAMKGTATAVAKGTGSNARLRFMRLLPSYSEMVIPGRDFGKGFVAETWPGTVLPKAQAVRPPPPGGKVETPQRFA